MSKKGPKDSLQLEELMALRVKDSKEVVDEKNMDNLLDEMIALKQKVLKQEEVIASLKKDAMSDPLTGLVNRRVFEKELNRSLSAARRYKKHSALMMIDVDDFKSINDQLGHPTGDKVLLHIANLLRQNTRPTDVVARLGGDEFCVIMNELPMGLNVENRATVLSGIIDKSPCTVDKRSIQVSVSIGVYAFDEEDDISRIIKQADENMYAKKAMNE